jgi:glutamate racemase
MTGHLIPKDRPVIGVFDSGFGGLTVLRALLPRFPGAHFVYLGDTARLPYGAKSQMTVARYAVEAARFLVRNGAQLLVIACNTATALALPEIRAAVSVPVIGVIEPGAQAALAAINLAASAPARTPSDTSATAMSNIVTASGQMRPEKVLVLATAATVASHAYRDTCETLGLQATEMPCPLLVPLVEEGWTDHHVTREVLRIYLSDALARTTPDAVVLGCTHYPLIAPAIIQALRDLGCHAPVVDSAEATAEAARSAWNSHAFQNTAPPPSFTCYATDSVEKFARLGTSFLGQPIPAVHLLDLD